MPVRRLPSGWTAQRLTGRHVMRIDRSTRYYCPADDLVVRRVEYKWRIFHRGLKIVHVFDTAKAAIEHAEDARFGG